MREIIADLTEYFAAETKDKIEAVYITADEAEGTKAIEIKFNSEIPQDTKNVMLKNIGHSLLNTCVEAEGKTGEEEFLNLMDNMQLKEWRE
jgi:hypothetical protein